MAKKTTKAKPTKFTSPGNLKTMDDFSSWNFVIFLTLGFILLVIVLAAMRNVSLDLRSKAGLACKEPKLPRAEACVGGSWKFSRRPDNGCPAFYCETTMQYSE